MIDQLADPDPPVNPPRRTAARHSPPRVGSEHGTAWSRELMQVLPALPDSLRRIRVALTEWLDSLRWPDDDADDLLLAVNEAVSNVIEHAYPHGHPGPVRMHAWSSRGAALATRRATVVISDRGDWGHDHRTVDPGGYRGRGLAIMSACTAELHIQRAAGGTTVILVSTDVLTL